MKILVSSNATMKNKLMALVAVGLLVGSMAVQAAPGGVTDGLRVWLRADTGISANDGEAVEVWADQSGGATMLFSTRLMYSVRVRPSWMRQIRG